MSKLGKRYFLIVMIIVSILIFALSVTLIPYKINQAEAGMNISADYVYNFGGIAKAVNSYMTGETSSEDSYQTIIKHISNIEGLDEKYTDFKASDKNLNRFWGSIDTSVEAFKELSQNVLNEEENEELKESLLNSSNRAHEFTKVAEDVMFGWLKIEVRM